MQDRTKDIRAAVGLVAADLSNPASKGPSPDTVAAFEFMIGNALVDLHTIARAQSKMASLEPWRDPLLDPVRKGKG